MDLQTIVRWFGSGDGRLVIAAALFALMWALKSIPLVKAKLLTTRRRKQLALAFMAMAPAVFMLAEGAAIRDVVTAAITYFLGAMGVSELQPKKEPS